MDTATLLQGDTGNAGNQSRAMQVRTEKLSSPHMHAQVSSRRF